MFWSGEHNSSLRFGNFLYETISEDGGKIAFIIGSDLTVVFIVVDIMSDRQVMAGCRVVTKETVFFLCGFVFTSNQKGSISIGHCSKMVFYGGLLVASGNKIS